MQKGGMIWQAFIVYYNVRRDTESCEKEKVDEREKTCFVLLVLLLGVLFYRNIWVCSNSFLIINRRRICELR